VSARFLLTWICRWDNMNPKGKSRPFSFYEMMDMTGIRETWTSTIYRIISIYLTNNWIFVVTAFQHFLLIPFWANKSLDYWLGNVSHVCVLLCDSYLLCKTSALRLKNTKISMQMRIEPLNRIIALGFFMSPVLIFTDRKADFVLSDAQL
jgi:hypothetical protein